MNKDSFSTTTGKISKKNSFDRDLILENYHSIINQPGRIKENFSRSKFLKDFSIISLAFLALGGSLGTAKYFENTGIVREEIISERKSNDEKSVLYQKYNFVSELLNDTRSSLNNGNYSLDHLVIDNHRSFWQMQPYQFSSDVDSTITELSSLSEQVMRSSYPLTGLVKNHMIENGFPNVVNKILIPAIFFRIETSYGNPYAISPSHAVGIGQFTSSTARSYGLSVDSDFENYMFEGYNKGQREVLPILYALKKVAIDRNTTILSLINDGVLLDELDQRLDVKKEVPATIAKLDDDLESSDNDIYEVIVKYNTSWAWVGTYRQIGSNELKGHDNYRFPLETRQYMRNFDSFMGSLTNSKNIDIVKNLVNQSDSFFENILDDYENHYLDQLTKLAIIYEYNFVFNKSFDPILDRCQIGLDEVMGDIGNLDYKTEEEKIQLDRKLSSVYGSVSYVISNYLDNDLFDN